jgi:hypothetical protein
MLKIGDAKGAEGTFNRLLDTYAKDPKFAESAGGPDQIMLWKVMLSASYRGEGKFAAAETLAEDLVKQYPKKIEPLMERAMVMEGKAEAKKLAWSAVASNWRSVANRLGNSRVRPIQFYDAWYHAALAMNREGKGKEAKQALGGIMRLSPKVGNPEMKKKYEALLSQIKS